MQDKKRSSWSIREIARIILFILQVILILVMSWFVSSDNLWGAEEDYQQVSKTYKEMDEQYTHSNIAAEKELVFQNAQSYAISSINKMLEKTSELQSLIQSFEWLDEDSLVTLNSFIDSELIYLGENKEQILSSQSTDEIKLKFKVIYEGWMSFRAGLNFLTREPFSRSILETCDKVITEENQSLFDTNEEIMFYTNFDSSCEDWGKEENVDLSASLLELIKIIE